WVLLFVGRPAPVEGREVLRQALARWRAEGLARADVHLVIVGGDRDEGRDDERTRLRALADTLGVGGWVDFKGPQLQSALPDYYRAADLCLVPSHHETFGMAALEAMACGATVVASRVGGLAATLQHGINGVLVPPRDDAARRRPRSRRGDRAAARRRAPPALARPPRHPLGAELRVAVGGTGPRRG